MVIYRVINFFIFLEFVAYADHLSHFFDFLFLLITSVECLPFLLTLVCIARKSTLAQFHDGIRHLFYMCVI